MRKIVELWHLFHTFYFIVSSELNFLFLMLLFRSTCFAPAEAAVTVWQAKTKDKGGVVYVQAKGVGNCLLMVETFTEKSQRTRQDVQCVMKKFG